MPMRPRRNFVFQSIQFRFGIQKALSLSLLLICLVEGAQAWLTSPRNLPFFSNPIQSRPQKPLKGKHFNTHSHAQNVNDGFSSSFEAQKETLLEDSKEPLQELTIRNCKYADLNAVADIIVESFYEEKMKSSPFSAILKFGELNRLQQNFPYNDSERHVMLVATISDSKDLHNGNQDYQKIVGFVDVDARPSTRRIDPPRPYLSDLAVHPEFRRRGIAKRLIQTCEQLVQSGSVRVKSNTTTASTGVANVALCHDIQDNMSGAWTKLNASTDSCIVGKEMFIRVERTNSGAIQMYQKFNYRPIEHAIFGVEDTTVLLHKQISC